MRVFISWSGAASHKVAVALRDWLPSVIQAIDPFVSSEDIERGARWFSDIGDNLESVNFGILCITPENLRAPWVMFEAGALSKNLDQSRVTPLLIGVKNSDIEGPLSQFNTTAVDKSEILKLLKTINKQLGDLRLPEESVQKAFEKWWPELEELLSTAVVEASKNITEKVEPRRSQGDILEEILELTRNISRQVAKTSADEEIKNAFKQFMLSSRAKDLRKDFGNLSWNDLKLLTASDMSKLKGKEFVSREDLSQELKKLLARKLKEDEREDDDSDN